MAMTDKRWFLTKAAWTLAFESAQTWGCDVPEHVAGVTLRELIAESQKTDIAEAIAQQVGSCDACQQFCTVIRGH